MSTTEYLDIIEPCIALPKPINKNYKVGDMVSINKRDIDGFVKMMRVKVIGVYEYFIRVEIPTEIHPYSECFLYTDMR